MPAKPLGSLSLAILDARAGMTRLGVSFFCSFGRNALINLDSGKWIEIFGTTLTLFGRASRARKKRSEGDLKPREKLWGRGPARQWAPHEAISIAGV